MHLWTGTCTASVSILMCILYSNNHLYTSANLQILWCYGRYFGILVGFLVVILLAIL